MMHASQTVFAPQLYFKHGITNVDFYSRAFNAIELRRWINEDGSLHVVELSIDGSIFHLHEESPNSGFFCPEHNDGVTAIVGLFVDNVDSIMQGAIAAGAIELTPAQDYDYGYRQGILKDPFGHVWMIESKIQERDADGLTT